MIPEAEKKERRAKTAKPMMWMALVSISMMFAGLTSGYVVVQGDSFWVQTKLPQLFWISTGIIILSSATLVYALSCARKGNNVGLKIGLIATLILGFGFSYTQFKGWGQMIDSGNFFRENLSHLKGVNGLDYKILFRGEEMIYANGHYYGAADLALQTPLDERLKNSFNMSSGFKYVLSGLHLIHLLGGLIYLILLIFRAFAGRYSPESLLDLELCSIYWHFLDVLWIYLFGFLYFIN